MYEISKLTLDILKQGKVSRIYYGDEVKEVLDLNGYIYLGWLNDGFKPPKDIVFTDQYSNDSGTYCVYVNHEHKMYYCVDMGD